MTILFATDGSPEAAEACRVLNLLSLPSGSVIHVISALHVPPLTDGGHAPWQTIQYLFEWHESGAADGVDAARKLLAREGVRVEASIPRGDPTPQILRAADAIDADLIVMGPGGLSSSGSSLGSVARNVASRCQHPNTHCTEHERAAAEFRKQQEESGRKLLAEAVALLPASRGVRHELRFGDPATEILHVAGEREADLILMGARGTSLLDGLLMGSVADRLLTQAACSVLIVH